MLREKNIGKKKGKKKEKQNKKKKRVAVFNINNCTSGGKATLTKVLQERDLHTDAAFLKFHLELSSPPPKENPFQGIPQFPP